MANRWGIPKEVEEQVKKRDLNCVYCGISFGKTSYNHKTRPTWEHIINDIQINGSENVALCCGSCNASKGRKKLQDWLNSKYCTGKGITIKSVAHVVKDFLENNK
jgi:5-methylcytosine-specific restriction endonuclease McrA